MGEVVFFSLSNFHLRLMASVIGTRFLAYLMHIMIKNMIMGGFCLGKRPNLEAKMRESALSGFSSNGHFS